MTDLEGSDYELAVESLIFKKGGTRGAADIYYSKINGNVALRPRCCVGPAMTAAEVEPASKARCEFTLSEMTSPASKEEIVTYLERVTKKDMTENPLMKESRASERLREIEQARSRRKVVTIHGRKREAQ